MKKRTDLNREAFLVRALETGHSDTAAGRSYVTAELVNDVISEIRFNLRKLDAPSQRRIMRTYGARYTYLEGEPMEADEAPAAAAE